MAGTADITADAIALQERDEFCAQGWLKVLAPAKVNLHLAVGPRREDGYHEVETVVHAVNLHDVVYLRRALPDSPAFGLGVPAVRMVAGGDADVPAIDSADNLASKAIVSLANALGLPESECELELRIEKNIPAQAGLGGGSSDAAAALVGAARLWGLAPDDPAIEQAAQSLGADVALFLRGACARYEGAGERHAGSLQASRQSIALVKPAGGVSTAEAYRAFDEHPDYATPHRAAKVQAAEAAADVELFNNLAPAAERLMPELAEVRRWLDGRPGVQHALLCGSGAATFALCDDFSAACRVVADARKRGWWARASSLGSARAMAVPTEGAPTS